MGKLNLGILGGFSGTVGTVVGSTNKKGEVLRSAKTANLPIPYSEPGDQLLFYLFFQSATDGALVSTNQYLGTVTVAE